VLYVGTKKQAQEAIAEQARRVGMPFVNQRWLGGMLTNFSTVYKRLQRLKELEEIDFDDVSGSNMTKKELLQLRRERDKLERSLGGIRDMSRVPSAIWVVDTKKEHIAISEARKLGIPVIAILDTNCDPDEVNYPIPGNDDAIRSVALLTRVIADAVADGLIARAGRAAGEEKPQGDGQIGAAEPLAEWERELLEGRNVNGANGAATAASVATEAATGAAAATATASAEPASTATASTETASAGPASTATASTETASTEAATEPAGTGGAPEAGAPEAASAEAASTEAASAEAASTEAATADPASTEAASTEAATADAASTEAASTEAASTEA
jgi:small subunit ribosomal protein S2